MKYGYIGAKPTFIGNYDGFNTGVFGMSAVNNLIAEEKFAGYLGSTIAGTFYAHAFGYNFTTTASNATLNVNGENYNVTGKLFNGDTTLGTTNLSTSHGAVSDRTYIAKINGNLTINGTVTIGTQVRGCVFAVAGNVTLSSGSIVGTDYGSDSYQPSQDWNIVRSDLNGTHSVSNTDVSEVSNIFVGNRGASGSVGTAGTNGRSGAGGAGGVWNGSTSTAYGNRSGAGGIFAGGAGGGSSVDSHTPADAGDYGGAGGSISSGGGTGWGGGAGNPAGAGHLAGSNGGFGVGGNITIIAKGNVTIDSSSSITSNGSNGGNSNATSTGQFSAGGGASGGGSFIVFCGGSYTNNGSITLNGGSGGSDVHSSSTSPSGSRGGRGGNGGAGSSLTVSSVQFSGSV